MQSLTIALEPKQKATFDTIYQYHEDEEAWFADAGKRAKEEAERKNEQRAEAQRKKREEKERKLAE
jgi:hypothetical protein